MIDYARLLIEYPQQAHQIEAARSQVEPNPGSEGFNVRLIRAKRYNALNSPKLTIGRRAWAVEREPATAGKGEKMNNLLGLNSLVTAAHQRDAGCVGDFYLWAGSAVLEYGGRHGPGQAAWADPCLARVLLKEVA